MVVRSDRLGGLRLVFDEAARDLTAAGEFGGYSLLEHMLQCADLLRAWRPNDEELALAGLVHDIGHVLDASGTGAHPGSGNGGPAGGPPVDDDRHGEVAADYLFPLFGERVARLVALHVPAKRYLVAVADDYGDLLSPASTLSLSEQGAAMSLDEQRGFEADPLAADAVLLRKADDLAKQAGRVVPGMEQWWPVLEMRVSNL